MQKITLSGTIILDEIPLKNNRPNYIIKSLVDNSQTSVTKILDTIFNSTNTISKLVDIKGIMFNTGHNFKCFGKLIIGREDHKTKVDAYMVNGFPIMRQLFELLDTNIEIIICDYTDSIGEFITDLDLTDTTATMKDGHNYETETM